MAEFYKSWEPKTPGLWSKFWIGTQLGLLWTPCAEPALGSILVLAAVQHEVLGALALLTVYGLGVGIPLLAIAYSSRYISSSSRRLLPHTATLQRVEGVLNDRNGDRDFTRLGCGTSTMACSFVSKAPIVDN